MNTNDEPVFEDELGHYKLVRQVGHRILSCHPPYVIGICGSWGAGKTSFLKMLWAYLGGKFEIPPARGLETLSTDERLKWFEETPNAFDELIGRREIELVWFNPWQHQFESSPLVALLHEIREQLTLKRKLVNEAGKLVHVSLHAMFGAVEELAKGLKLPVPSAKGIVERGREYESEHFSTALTSQRFRQFFEAAIDQVTGNGKNSGLLVIFVDDLDRCEGDVAYRLMEALKLYMNAANCVYVLGMDQSHLESSIAKALSGESETFRHRPRARDYLNKIFQNLFLLPVPREISKYIRDLLDPADARFAGQMHELFGLSGERFELVVEALDRCLPHNPRKVKAFVSSWKLHLDMLETPTQTGGNLYWRLSLILHYLAQFEEPIFRKVEEAPAFYNDEVIRFCEDGVSRSRLFEGLERPYIRAEQVSAHDPTGGLDPTLGLSQDAHGEGLPKRAATEPRVFWISYLINELAEQGAGGIEANEIRRHLVQTGGR